MPRTLQSFWLLQAMALRWLVLQSNDGKLLERVSPQQVNFEGLPLFGKDNARCICTGAI